MKWKITILKKNLSIFSNFASVIKDICKSTGRCIVHEFPNFFAHSDLQKCPNINWCTWTNIYVYENAQWCEKPNFKRMSICIDGGVKMILLIWWGSCVRHNFELFNSWDCVRCNTCHLSYKTITFGYDKKWVIVVHCR